MNNPSSITSTPGYQANFSQGLEALQRTEAAQGSLNSSQADAAAMSYGQNFQSQYFSNYEGMLAQLAGGNLTQGNAGAVYANSMQSANAAGSGAFGGLLQSMGLGGGGGSGPFGSLLSSMGLGGGGGTGMTGTADIGAAGADAAGNAGAAAATDLGASGSGGLGDLLASLAAF
jgi:hypothetical protein